MKKNLKLVLIGIAAVALIVGYYYYLSNRNNQGSRDEDVEISSIEKVLDKDLENNYPKTPRAVVKYFNEVVTCLYNEVYTENEMEKMGNQQRKLLDDDLLSENQEEEYFTRLRQEVQDFKKQKKKIANTYVSSTEDVVYKQVDGRECAYVTASYFINEGDSYTKTYQRFVLRKDSDGKWKILVFYLIKGGSDE